MGPLPHFVEHNGSGIELRTLDYEYPDLNPVLQCILSTSQANCSGVGINSGDLVLSIIMNNVILTLQVTCFTGKTEEACWQG